MSVNSLFVHTLLGISPYPRPPRRASATSAPAPRAAPTAPAPKKLEQYTSLEELKKALQSFEHPLKQPSLSFVFSDGSSTNKLMLIGEAPGAQEDAEGKPFVGKSGQLLTRMFSHIGYTREQLYITNIVPWRPPNNRTPSPSEIAAFQPFVKEHIRLIQPKAVVLVGNTPLHAFFNTQYGGITRAHGQWLSLSVENTSVPCMPVYHPAFLLRSPSKKKEFWMDLLSLKEKLSTLK